MSKPGTIVDVQGGSSQQPAVSDIDSAADALLARWKKPAAAKQPTEPVREGKPARVEEETSQHAAEETETQHEETQDEPGHEAEDHVEGDEGTEATESEQAETALAADDHEVEIAVDGETRRVPVKDLKRLFGQEAALTRKSQEVADARKQAETVGARYNTGLTKMLERAEARWKPYAEIDFLVAQQNLQPEEFRQLRAAAADAFKDVQFFKQELDGHTQELTKEHQTKFNTAAQECIQVLTDPEKGIKGWDQKMYNDLREFSAKNGFSEQLFNTVTNPAVFKIMHMAHQYAQAQTVATTKLAKAPKNVVGKTKTNGTGTTPKSIQSRQAMEKLRTSGSTDDAADAFMARWGVRD